VGPPHQRIPPAIPVQTVITTHFRELGSGGLFDDSTSGSDVAAGALPPSAHLSFYHMNVVLENDAEGEGAGGESPLEEVTPLFKLVPGHAASSYGLACASKAGVPAPVLRRAAAVTAALRSNSPIMPAQAWTRSGRRAAWEAAMITLLKAVARVARASGEGSKASTPAPDSSAGSAAVSPEDMEELARAVRAAVALR